ncbi:MAG TPA: PilT/PilU family type 4a pilus ATPase [Gemmatimonadota bacterium]|nr:PilT/PilU family type 4a pilus ATPase [Gemmatimonadota bacterium]
MEVREVLKTMLQSDASDLHLKVGAPPIVRLHGELAPVEGPPLSREEMDRVLRELLTEDQLRGFAGSHELDCAIGVRQLGRFRINAAFQRGTPTITIRAIPVSIKSILALNLPPVIGSIALRPRGLVLVTGVTGSGKTTTLAAMIEHINARRRVKIVTIEDPIEYLFRDNKAFISQREVGTDTGSFETALRHVLRQDPDVLMVGEIRDQETMDIAIKAANTGHLVFATLHTTNAVQTIQRVLTFFPIHQHNEVRALLAENLQGVVSQRLLQRVDGKGRVPSTEVMVSTEAIRDFLHSPDSLDKIQELISEGHVQYGMQTFDQSLMALFREGMITEQEALDNASNSSEFALRLRGIESASDRAWETA